LEYGVGSICWKISREGERVRERVTRKREERKSGCVDF